MILKTTSKVTDELYKDKRELKEEVKLLKKKIKRHKNRYKTLNKVFYDQQTLKLGEKLVLNGIENKENIDIIPGIGTYPNTQPMTKI